MLTLQQVTANLSLDTVLRNGKSGDLVRFPPLCVSSATAMRSWVRWLALGIWWIARAGWWIETATEQVLLAAYRNCVMPQLVKKVNVSS
jgi:hypothetical protein